VGLAWGGSWRLLVLELLLVVLAEQLLMSSVEILAGLAKEMDATEMR
jgi:hypothetical protein